MDSVFQEAQAILQKRRDKALDRAAQRRAEFVAQVPEYAELEREISKTSILIARKMLTSEIDIESAMNELRDNNLSQQRRMAQLLEEHGFLPDYLNPSFQCAACSDTGFVDGKVCDCLKKEIRRVRYNRLNAVTPLALCSFDTFDLSIYSDEEEIRGVSQRRLMKNIYDKCVRYADSFSLASPSLLFQGGVGLGKTHLSLAIAQTVIERGYAVVYGSAQSLLERIENEHFGRASVDNDTRTLCKDCDLLILDDLGVEFNTPFTSSALYDIINTRLLAERPTIISTNLDIQEIQKRYTERFASRISGSYDRYKFVGKDIRIILRKSRKDG